MGFAIYKVNMTKQTQNKETSTLNFKEIIMIETIDQITTDDLFNALGNNQFLFKLITASDRRKKHYAGWYQSSPGIHKFKEKMVNHGILSRILGKIYNELS